MTDKQKIELAEYVIEHWDTIQDALSVAYTDFTSRADLWAGRIREDGFRQDAQDCIDAIHRIEDLL